MGLSDVRRSVCLLLLMLVAIAAAPATPLRAADAAAAARDISRKWGDAVITIKVALKMRWVAEGQEAEETESTGEVNGTVIDPSGLVVCSLSQVDPSQRMDQSEEEDFKLQAEVTDLKLLRPDGREIAARIVLRDKDLDLAFIRPTAPLAQPMLALELSSDVQPQVLDEIVILGRMSQTANRAGMVALDRITAIVEKPRTVYVGGMNTYLCGLGSPAISLEGKAIGVTFMRSAPPGAEAGRGQSGPMPVILPSAQILAVAGQVPKE